MPDKPVAKKAVARAFYAPAAAGKGRRSDTHFLVICGTYFLCSALHYGYSVVEPQRLVAKLFDRLHIVLNIQQSSAV